MTGDWTLLGNWNTRCFFFTVLESMKSTRKRVNNLVLCQGSCAMQTPASLPCLTGLGENDLFLSPPFLIKLLIPPLPHDPPSWPPLIQDKKVQYKYSQHMNEGGNIIPSIKFSQLLKPSAEGPSYIRTLTLKKTSLFHSFLKLQAHRIYKQNEMVALICTPLS